MAARVVYERGNDLVNRLIGRAALFQAYTSVLAVPALYTGFIRPPPGYEAMNDSLGFPILVLGWGVGSYMVVKAVNDRIVSKMSLAPSGKEAIIETVSSTSKKDKTLTCMLKDIKASPFTPNSPQTLIVGSKTFYVVHRANKHTDIMFFSNLGKRM